MSGNQIIYEDAKRIVDSCELSELAGKTVLITGASGLIGTYLLYSLNELSLRGDAPQKVYAVIHRSIPCYLSELTNRPWMEFVPGDLSDISFCASLPQAQYIIHASGYGQPGKFLNDPVSAIKQNTLATYLLLDRLLPGGKFLFVSSGAVYAENPKPSYTENDISFATLDAPRLCYIEGKRCGEAISELYRRNGVHAKIVRLSFTYGPGVREDDVRVLYEFIRKGMAGDIHMRDQGRGVHIYEYISDAVEEIWNVLLRGKENVYNIAGHSEISIYRLASGIAEHLKVRVVVPEANDTVPGAIMKQYVDPTRVETEFHKTQFVPFETGLRNTVDWFVRNYRK